MTIHCLYLFTMHCLFISMLNFNGVYFEEKNSYMEKPWITCNSFFIHLFCYNLKVSFGQFFHCHCFFPLPPPSPPFLPSSFPFFLPSLTRSSYIAQAAVQWLFTGVILVHYSFELLGSCLSLLSSWKYRCMPLHPVPCFFYDNHFSFNQILHTLTGIRVRRTNSTAKRPDGLVLEIIFVITLLSILCFIIFLSVTVCPWYLSCFSVVSTIEIIIISRITKCLIPCFQDTFIY